MTLESFIAALRKAELEPGVENILDALWLATRSVSLTLKSPSDALDAGAEVTPTVLPPPPPKSGSLPPPRETPPAAPPSNEKWTMPVYAPGGARGAGTGKASPVTLPAGRALTNRLQLTRALRPLRQRWQSHNAAELDEESTVDATAELGGLLFPVFRPLQERWYDADIVLEDDPAVDLWHDTMRDFRQMLWDTGAFRDVRWWRLRMAPSTTSATLGAPKPPVLETPSGTRAPIHTVSGNGVRRLIFFATHGSSRRWQDSSYARVLEPWARSSSVVLLHLLPRTRWKRTPLGEPQGTCIAQEPGAVSARLRVERPWWTFAPEDKKCQHVILPAMPLNPAAFSEWAGGEECLLTFPLIGLPYAP